ncbi:MAG: AmmeMemoRadiSam system radical SAM enzyme [Salinivirgaceae bacterium]|nr:AmmeMemoRadiSam system radical SAM enzyme [Salinivirgaceae bacterium]
MSNKKEALYYNPLENNAVQCLLCPHNCVLEDGYKGVCQVRKNLGGKLYALSYGIVSAINIDPVEKKPLYHFNPGKHILSVGGFGCNMRCMYCQNHAISQVCDVDLPKDKTYTPESIIEIHQRTKNSCGIAFTYNEITVNYEFVLETAKLATQHQIPVVLVTNGFINKEPLLELLPYVSALNIDLKAFNDDFYRKYTGGSILPVLETILTAHAAKKHVEITFLAINGLNDRPAEFNLMVEWIKENLGAQVPLHISKYFPNYKLTNVATPESTLITLLGIATQKLNYIYLGNIDSSEHSKTRCTNCYSVLVERTGYEIRLVELNTMGECNNCKTHANFIFSELH